MYKILLLITVLKRTFCDLCLFEKIVFLLRDILRHCSACSAAFAACVLVFSVFPCVCENVCVVISTQ